MATRGTQIEAAGMGGYPQRADEFNERNSMYILPLADAFRMDWAPNFERLTNFVERLKMPIVVMGVGAQAPLGVDPLEELRPMEPMVRVS